MIHYFHPSPLKDCVINSITMKNVMLNQVLNLFQDLRFQHLTKSKRYETLKRVQADEKEIATQSLTGGGHAEGD